MGLYDDLIGSQAPSSSRGRRTKFVPSLSLGSVDNAERYRPHSSTLLASTLNQIASGGDKAAYRRARAIAAGGGGSIAGKALQKAMYAVGLPQRIVLTTAEEAIDAATGKFKSHDYWKDVNDPTFGAGRIVQEHAPDMNIWLKRALGLTGDIATDPLTYLSFGASEGIKEGGLEAIHRLAMAKADNIVETASKKIAEAGLDEAASKTAMAQATLQSERVKDLGTRALQSSVRRGGATTPELAELAQHLGMPEDALRYGVQFHVPLTDIHEMIPGTERIGRGVYATGQAASKAVKELPGVGKVADVLGGYVKSAKEALRSGDARTARRAAAFIDGTMHSEATGRNFTSTMEHRLGSVKKALKGTGLLNEDLDEIVRQRPVRTLAEDGKSWVTDHALYDAHEIPKDSPARLGGPDWQAAMANDKARPLILEAAAFDDALFHDANAMATHGDWKVPAIHSDARQRLRAFSPRTETPEFRASFGRMGDTSKSGLAVKAAEGSPGEAYLKGFEAKYGAHLDEGRLHLPGEKLSTGELAGSLEDQTDAAYRGLHGDEAVPWYERDYFKTRAAYVNRMANQVRETKRLNYMADHGITEVFDHHAPPEAWVGTTKQNPAAGGTWWQKTANEGAGIADDTPGQSSWAPHLFKAQGPEQGMGVMQSILGEARQRIETFAGKFADPRDYHDLQRFMDEVDDTVRSTNTQFAAWGGDAKRAANKAGFYDDMANRLEAQGHAGALDDFANEIEKAGSPPQSVAEWRARADEYRTAQQFYDLRGTLRNEDEARVAHLAAKTHELLGAISQASSVDSIPQTRLADAMTNVLGQAWEGFGAAREMPEDIARYTAEMSKAFGPVPSQGIQTFLSSYYDPMNNWMKGWLTVAPGFSWRNMLGGLFNNNLAGVQLRNQLRWAKTLQKQMGKELMDLTPYEALNVRLAEKAGLMSGSFSGELGDAVMMEKSVSPLAGTGLPLVGNRNKINYLPAWSRRFNETVVEPTLRGGLFHDRIVKAFDNGNFAHLTEELGFRNTEHLQSTLTHDQVEAVADAIMHTPQATAALEGVDTYHFNYNDMSSFERKYVKRLIPFYTWTRHNVPLQVENFVTQPGKSLALYLHLKNNLELGTPGEPIVPGYFGEQGLIHLPWKSSGGDTYGGVNLPFMDPFKTLDVGGQVQGMLTPFLKAPIEVARHEQFQTGVPITHKFVPVPGTWQKIPGFMQAIQAAGKLPFSPLASPVKDANGDWMMRNSDAYLLGQYVPFLATSQRLAPSEARYQKRLTTTWISFLGGLQVRTNTPNEIENEIFRRADELQTINAQLKARGLGGETKTQASTVGHRIGGKRANAKAPGPGPSLSSILAGAYQG